MKGIISKLEVQKRDKDRVNVYINEEFSFACNAELVYTHDLKKGKEIDLEYIKSVVEEDNYLKGKNYSLKIIEKTYKTEKEIRDKLLKKEYGYKEINRIIDFLKEYKFLDDRKYVEMFIKDRIRKFGRGKIKYDLAKKGIEEELISKGLNSIDYDTEYNAAALLGENKYKSLLKSEKDVRKNMSKIYKKVGDFLIRRGYDFQIINEIVTNLKNNNNEVNFNEQYNLDCDVKEEKDELVNLALKRYAIISKSESDYVKIYRRLASYLMRRGYSYEEVSKVLKEILSNYDN